MDRNDIDWSLLRSFLTVAERGSFSAAARFLGLTQPTLGRHIEELERTLQKKLFVRSGRGLIPTDAALELLQHAKAMAASADVLVRVASGDVEEEKGTVRLAASEIIGVEVLPSIIERFRRTHPAIDVELVLSNQNENLLYREADVAIRMVQPTQKQLIARKLGDVPIKLFAHRNYAKRRGLPQSLKDLKGHDFIGYDKTPLVFERKDGADQLLRRGDFKLRCDHDLCQLALLRAGAGIGGMQMQLAARDSKLLPVLHQSFVLPLEMWLVMHEDLRSSRRTRLLFDFLVESLSVYVRGTAAADKRPLTGKR